MSGWKTKDGQELSEEELEVLKLSINGMIDSFRLKDWIGWFCDTFTKEQLREATSNWTTDG